MSNFHASYEYAFDPAQPNNTAATIYHLAREGGRRVLDLGSGPAIVSAYLRSADGKDVTALDAGDDYLKAARERGILRTIQADLENPTWIDTLAGETFDVIILADVLEHLRSPEIVLQLILERHLLSPEGFLVISIPNATHEGVVGELLTGKFTYRETGLLDSTHLRFFSRDSFLAFCESAGFTVTRLHRTRRTLEQTDFAESAKELPTAVRAQLARVPEAQTYQFVARVEPMEGAQELARLRAENADLRTGNSHLEDEVARLNDESTRQRNSAELRRLSEVALTNRVERLTEQSEYQRQRLQKIYSSRTWKIGRAVVGAMRLVKQPRTTVARLRGKKARKLTGAAPAQTAAGADRLATTPLAHYTLADNTAVREAYVKALAKKSFGTSGGTRVVMALHTLELDEGRGDVYTGVALGRYLERLGYEVIYLPRDRWYEVPEETDVYIALLDEVDLWQVPARCLRVAWIRNRTFDWADSPSLALYDAVLCSSELSLKEIKRVFRGPTGILRIGVDPELFNPAARNQPRQGVSSTVNQWGKERQIYRALRECARDFPLAIFGEQRGLHEDLVPNWVGKVSYFALPSLYHQTALVLDDHNHTTQPLGNVNSRIYEALACGAPVVSNATTGLHEIGLTEIPVYTTAQELNTRIHEVLRDSEAVASAAARMQRVVFQEHTYERRAQELDMFLRNVTARAAHSDRIVVGFSPDYRRTNPYQSMLYGWDGEANAEALPVPSIEDLLSSTLPDLGKRLVYHLHWTAPILGPAKSEREAEKKRIEFLSSLDALRAKGATFVWTIHNVLPHECRFPEIESALRQGLADRADMIHVMCEASIELVSAHFTLPRGKVKVIPHPSYIDVYPNILDQERARAELGLPSDATVLCFFGGIRPYKGLPDLLDAFEAWAGTDTKSRLIVAGPAGRFPDVERLRDRCEANPRIVSMFNPIPSSAVQIYLNAADVVVLPHRAVLNSGSLMLAYSFGRPVIAPASGCLDELLTPDASLVFDTNDRNGLLEALFKAEQLKDDTYRRAAMQKALAYPANGIAGNFLAAMADLTNR